MGELDGKAIVVTGAGRGLGRAYARAAAAEGAAVVVNDVDAEEAARVAEELRSSGASAIGSSHDVADASQASALVDACRREFGRLDGLVNNAGLFHVSAPWEEDRGRLERLIRANVLGTMYCGLAAIDHMREAGSGSIVNVVSGAHLGLPGMSTYGASKGAVTSVTFAWAIDLAGSGVRVNAISPIGRTRMTDAAGVTSNQPDPALIAPLCVYLLSERSTSLTGQVIRLDGTDLSILSPAAFGDPAPSAGTWDVGAIDAVFRSGAVGPQPVGLGRGHLTP